MTLGRWFHLRDSERTSFELSPERDADIWCGDPQVEKNLREALRAGIEQGVPKLLFYGEYGTGKTHSLFHCRRILEDRRCHCVAVVWSGFSSRTRFSDLFRETMKSVSPSLPARLVRDHLREHQGEFILPGDLGELVRSDSDLRQALTTLADCESLFPAPTLNERGNLAWRWLQCFPLNAKQRKDLGVAASLSERDSPAHLVNVLRLIGALLRERKDQKLVFLFDEAEQTNELRHNRDALNSFASAIRALFDRSQQDIGILLSFYAPRLEEQVFIRPDTFSRLDASQIIQLRPLDKREERIDFLEAVLTQLVERGQPKHFPFQTTALLLLAERCDQLDMLIEHDPRSIKSSRGDFTPRTILKALNLVTRTAFSQGEQEISREFLRKHFPMLVRD